MLSSDVLIICFLSLSIARDTELFDKRIKPWELQEWVLSLSEKINNESKERNSCVEALIFKQTVSPPYLLCS